jgi:hypothetical protein
MRKERQTCRPVVAAKRVRQDNMMNAAEGVSEQAANDKRGQAWLPRSCPWKPGNAVPAIMQDAPRVHAEVLQTVANIVSSGVT